MLAWLVGLCCFFLYWFFFFLFLSFQVSFLHFILLRYIVFFWRILFTSYYYSIFVSLLFQLAECKWVNKYLLNFTRCVYQSIYFVIVVITWCVSVSMRMCISVLIVLLYLFNVWQTDKYNRQTFTLFLFFFSLLFLCLIWCLLFCFSRCCYCW